MNAPSLRAACRAISLLAALSAATATAQIDRRAAAEFWQKPEFINAFLGSYGFLGEVEPRITAKEQELFRELIELIPTNPSAAAKKLKAAITPDSSAALDFTLANLNFQLGELEEAEKNYKEAIRKFPSFRRAFKNLGIVYVQKEKFSDAADALARSVELGGEDGNTYGLLGYCYLTLEKYASAESAYRKAILFAPDQTDWKLGLARTLLAQQKSREAAALFEELIQKDPEKPEYWLHQANAFLELGETAKAATNYEILRRMGKATGAALMTLGDIYITTDAQQLALEAYLASLEVEPTQDINRPLRAAEILTSRQAWAQAAALLGRISTVYKGRLTEQDSLRVLKLQAKVSLATGESREAVKTLNEIISRDPLDGEAMIILANHYAQTGQPERAELLYERAAKLKDHELNALIHHAQLLVAEGKYDKAAKLLHRAQTIQPRDTVARYLEQVERLARASM
jgi:Flp pilus assembly protein TadD